MTPFNPTLGIGQHKQIVEVQCQLEAYGKGSHPYYIGSGVIDGWEEYAKIMPTGRPRGLRDIAKSEQFAGVWTWSRGGGWRGPYIKNGLWADLNAYVVKEFVRNPGKSELEAFREYAVQIGVDKADIPKFRRLAELSAIAVLKGQLSELISVDVWYARDDSIRPLDLSKYRNNPLAEKLIKEKNEARRLWQEIVKLAGEIRIRDKRTKEFMLTSSKYGRYKYDTIAALWLMSFGSGQTRKDAFDLYDSAKQHWINLKKTDAECSSLVDLSLADKFVDDERAKQNF
jgi:hypothetical protein